MNNPNKPKSSEPAYHNEIFLDSDDGRPLRILAEYLEPLYRLKRERIGTNEGGRPAWVVL